jgi:hypothetical protein
MTNEADERKLRNTILKCKSAIIQKQQKGFFISSIVINYYTLSLDINIIRFEIGHGQKDGTADSFIASFMCGRYLSFLRFLITQSGFPASLSSPTIITPTSITSTSALFNCNYNSNSGK